MRSVVHEGKVCFGFHYDEMSGQPLMMAKGAIGNIEDILEEQT